MECFVRTVDPPNALKRDAAQQFTNKYAVAASAVNSNGETRCGDATSMGA